MNSIDELQSLVNLMQETLKFYAEENNYKKSPEFSKYPVLSNVDLDEHGSQARFALNRVKELNEINRKMQEEYDKLVMEAENLEPDGETNPIELINVFIKTHDDKNI